MVRLGEHVPLQMPIKHFAVSSCRATYLKFMWNANQLGLPGVLRVRATRPASYRALAIARIVILIRGRHQLEL